MIARYSVMYFELLAGDPAAAAEFGEEGCRMLEELGEQELPLDRGREAGASALCARPARGGRRLGRPRSRTRRERRRVTQMLWRQARAKVLARRGEHAEAERLAREAVAIGQTTDDLDGQGDARADLATVLELAGRREESAAEL